MPWPLPRELTTRILELVFRDGFDTTLSETQAVGSVCKEFAAALLLATISGTRITSADFKHRDLRHPVGEFASLSVRVGTACAVAEWAKACRSSNAVVTCSKLTIHVDATPPENEGVLFFLQNRIRVKRELVLFTSSSARTFAILRGMALKNRVHTVIIGGNSATLPWKVSNAIVAQMTAVFPNACEVCLGCIPLFEGHRPFATMSTIDQRHPGVLCPEVWGEALRRWPRLRRLAIAGGSLSRKHMDVLAAVCKGLVNLSISHCPEIDTGAIQTVCTEIPSLQLVDLASVNMTEHDARSLCARGRVIWVV